jgi:hypothetical protein
LNFEEVLFGLQNVLQNKDSSLSFGNGFCGACNLTKVVPML